MHTRKFLTAAFAFAILFSLLAPNAASASVSVGFSFFHDQLAPHGRWVVAGSFGDVWVPSGVAVGWSPYVNGQWVWTDYGWTWVSYDPWGDIPYHYGTWTWVSDYGWSWVPGTVWAPAWVTWAYSDDYIGWAPVPVSFVFTSGGYFGAPVVVTASHYCFVPTSQFVGVNVSNVRVPVAQNTTIFAGATKATRFQVSGGIVHTAGLDPARIQKATGQSIARTSISQIKTPPTTVAAAGVSKSKTVGVVAPAKVRAQELKTASAHTASKNATVNREANASASAKSTKTSPKTATTQEKARVAGKPEPKPKAKPEHHATATSSQSSSKSTHSKPATTEEKHSKPAVTEEKSRAAASHQPKASTTTAQKHVTTSSPRTAEVQHAKPAPQTHVAEKHVVEKPRHVESKTPRTEQHAVNRAQTVKAAPSKEHAPPPQQVASNRPSHSTEAPPKKVKNPPPKEEPKPKE